MLRTEKTRAPITSFDAHAMLLLLSVLCVHSFIFHTLTHFQLGPLAFAHCAVIFSLCENPKEEKVPLLLPL
ncbi:hypothetical protein VNO78_19637 [Psophocarpus tetragonolobus]|uniref:Uncharacterized protein n=1 Tax=Psophocarpus tetragonolobus TaxID=3891 RepID=A0AAN9XGE7_PSOTE